MCDVHPVATGRNLLRSKHDVAFHVHHERIAIPEESNFVLFLCECLACIIHFPGFFIELAFLIECKCCWGGWLELRSRIHYERSYLIPVWLNSVHVRRWCWLPRSGIFNDRILRERTCLFIVISR